MKPALAEVGVRPTTLKQRVKENPELKAHFWRDRVLYGRSLVVPDGEGGSVNLRVTTTRRHLLGDKHPKTDLRHKKRDVYIVGDYNDDSDIARISQAVKVQLPEGAMGQLFPVSVDRYATLSGSVALSEVVLNGDPEAMKNTIGYFNIAPRGADNGNGSLREVEWKGEQRQRLIFAVVDSGASFGIPVIGVDSNYNFAAVKDRLIAAWEIDYSHDLELQQRVNDESFRSLRVYPRALEILQGGRRGRKWFGREIDIQNEIPDAPAPTYNEETKELTANIVRVDGRQSRRGYGNQKLYLREEHLPDEIKKEPWLLGTVNVNGTSVTHLFVNTFSADAKKLATADFFLASGSTGDANDLSNHLLEANRFYYPAAEAYGYRGVTDQTTIIFKPVPEGELEYWQARDKEAREELKRESSGTQVNSNAEQSKETDGFRTATKEDFPALYALWQKAGLWTYDLEVEGAKFNERLQSDSSLQVVLKAGEKIIGGAFGTVDKGASTAWIHRVVVDPEFQRQGHGATLLRELEDRIEARGDVRTIKLQVHDLNNDVDSVNDFYQRRGYGVDNVTTRKKSL